jgi:membrane fusion protein
MNAGSLPLFRSEVVEARRQRVLGEIVLTQPVRTHVLVLLLFGIVALLALWVTLGTYTRTEAARGILATDDVSAKVVAIRPGVVTRLAVREGQLVRAGQTIATVQVEQGSETGGALWPKVSVPSTLNAASPGGKQGSVPRPSSLPGAAFVPA